MSEEHKKIPYNKEYSVTVEDALVRVIVYDDYDTLNITPPAVTTLHSHSFTELFICTSGKLTIATENGDIQLFSNDAAIIPAYMTHTLSYLHTNAKWCSIAFSIHKRSSAEKSDFYEMLSTLCSSKDAVILRNRPELCNAATSLLKMPSVFLPLPALKMCLCLAEIADTYKSESEQKEIRKTTPTDINHASKLEYIIETYYMNPLSSEQVANLMCVSKRQLSRIVQKRYGTTLRHVLLEKRLSVAAVMLENTLDTVQEISGNVGFSDVSVFRREFKNLYKISPTEYRELMRNSKLKRD